MKFPKFTALIITSLVLVSSLVLAEKTSLGKRVTNEFHELVTQEAVGVAVGWYLEENYYYHDLKLTTPMVNAWVRWSVFREVFGEWPVFGKIYNSWRWTILETARQYLQDPAQLKSVYFKLKPIFMAELAGKDAQPIRNYLEEILPYFTQEIPPWVMDTELAYQEVLTACRQKNECSDDQREFCGMCIPEYYDYSEHDLTFTWMALLWTTPDADALEWVLRRRAEGGQSLVQAWGDILSDLLTSLSN